VVLILCIFWFQDVDITDNTVLAFIQESFPQLVFEYDEISAVAKPQYLGKGKERKFVDVASDPSVMLAAFGNDQNEGAIGGFLEDTLAVNVYEGHASPEDEDIEDLATNSKLVKSSADLEVITEELEAMGIGDEIAVDASTSGLHARQPRSMKREGALVKSSVGISGSQAMGDPVAMTSDYLDDSKQCLHQFYEDEFPRQPKPSTPAQRQPTSLPAFINRKKVVPVRPGHIGIGGPLELARACNRWELLKDTGFQKWNRHVQREAEGVFLNNDFVEEHSISVDGRYDENIHWTRLDKIGEGCFGQVFTCQDRTTRALFCIKMVSSNNIIFN
jgi:hypothetical protein